ncbi:MAG TPA: DUF4118 domain-containing protein [Gemmatimonadales bacterium]|nr:DUF4118 domain-containing protein [Gemmatimonadales bacterium]
MLVTLTATVLRLLLQPLIGFDFPFITYFAAVFVSAWWFGFKPTLLTVLLSAFLTNLLFFSPTGADGRAGYLLGLIGLALFVGIGVGTAYMGKGRLDAQRRAETAAAEAQRLQAVAEEEAARAEEETTRADEESARAQSGNRFFALSRDMLCFTVWLPRRAPEKATPTAAKAPPAPGSRPWRERAPRWWWKTTTKPLH